MDIKVVEQEVDDAFFDNKLLDVDYAQSMWTILSVMEDRYLKATQIVPLEYEFQHVYLDASLNALTHPLRAIYFKNRNSAGKIIREVIDDQYGYSHDWLDKALVYNNFCSIFPLYWKKKITLTIKDDSIETTDWKSNEPQYEVYNRLIRKDGEQAEQILDTAVILELIHPHISSKKNRFELNLTPILVRKLVDEYAHFAQPRFKIPSDWECNYFTFGDFRSVYITLQAILTGRHIARTFLAMKGLPGLGYSDAVWVLPMTDLKKRLIRYTSLSSKKIECILDYLTFGKVGVKYPDIAIQPILDLKNGSVALSPFIFNNSNAERNLCVLLNQIEDEKKTYSKLTQDKEDVLRRELCEAVEDMGLECSSGKLSDTDVDFAIIDRQNRACIVFELKWFIEPAEVREQLERSQELQKGVEQAEKIKKKFDEGDSQLINDVLKIDSSFVFASAVGSRNWIGSFYVQSKAIPIIKVKHFIEVLRQLKSLQLAIEYLDARDYLPKEFVDYEIVDNLLQLGKWKCMWYGIKPILKEE
ncbi:hypothetical protein D0C16_07245 [Cellvibrio sp. KY-GH-1]|uniref:hypothetical protein n=1 Tax=Cellvibrio sp. KY-GH-1 TaxID=2303332 RepID=UPI0012449617|nr:hypothetical protein [Cellvibrio sp. KY-GH-1]QEY15787.1 hypothetical protein D0C16_07245 [Cellvibrio sp. KY-GH-1]